MFNLSHISEVSLPIWIFFSIGILILLFVDLSLFGKPQNHRNSKKAIIESLCWICVALFFNLWFSYTYGTKAGLEFLTAYLVEKSLSVDNLFVILLIFNSFKIPSHFQHRVLFYGVLGAIILRGLFIVVGAGLLHSFEWIMYVFGGILIYSGIKILIQKNSETDLNSNDSFAVGVIKKFLPTTGDLSEGRFFIVENRIKKATPLFLALIVVEVADLVFAVDSIPAVFAVTQDAFIAYASNILAILGLRALYFVLADWVVKLKYLKIGLSFILSFIGFKMLLHSFMKIPSLASLLVIIIILAIVTIASLFHKGD